MNITATLRDASFFNDSTVEPLRAPCIKGAVSADAKGRFYDGERITTSRIVDMFVAEDGAVIVKTRFSLYRVLFKEVPADVV